MGTEKANSGAIADLDKAIAMEPGQADYYFTRGICLSRLGMIDAAVADMSAVARLDPGDWQSLFIGQVRFELRQTTDALRDVEKALEIKPNDPECLRLHGDLLSYSGDYHKAVDAYNKSIRLKPRPTDNHEQRGVALANLGKGQQGMEDQKKAMDMSSPSTPESPAPVISGSTW